MLAAFGTVLTFSGCYWIGSIMEFAKEYPQAFSGFATISGAIIASIAALLIAFVAYPWQKKKDRELQIDAELRKICVEIVNDFHRYAVVVADESAGFNDRRDANQICLTRLALLRFFADDRLVKVAEDYHKKVDVFRDGLHMKDPAREEWAEKTGVFRPAINAAREAFIVEVRRQMNRPHKWTWRNDHNLFDVGSKG